MTKQEGDMFGDDSRMKFVKLKDGRVMIIWSINPDVETVHLYTLDKRHTFDVEVHTVTEYPYSDIVKFSTDLELVQA